MKILSLIPSQCPLCKGFAKSQNFCVACSKDIQHSMLNHKHRCKHCLLALKQPHDECPNCLDNFIDVQKIYAIFDYIPPMDSLILRYKEGGETYLSKYFAELLYKQLNNNNIDTSATNTSLNNTHDSKKITPETVLVPIPSRNQSLKRRGFNPAALFAKELQHKFKCKIDYSILRCRVDNLQMQKNLDKRQRFFASGMQYYCAYRANFKNAIIVDDILTTGSTIHSASRALKAAGVLHIEAMVIARASISNLFRYNENV